MKTAKLKYTVMSIACALICLCSAASVAGKEADQYLCRQLAETFFEKPLRQTIADFAQYDLPRQYEIYICGNQYMHPPALHLAAPFAAEGSRAALFLRDKLRSSSDDVTTRDIIRVFAEMQRQQSYDVAGDVQLMSLLRERADTVSNKYWRQYVSNLVAKIAQR
jgi:hypothetical protein